MTFRRWLYVGLSILILAAIIAIGVPVYTVFSGTRVERIPVEDNPGNFGLDYESISFPSRGDKLTLKGWYLPAGRNDRCIIIIHGGEGHRASPSIGTLFIAQGLIAHGYSVLMFDLRGHGESGGERISMGYYERWDVLGAIDYLTHRGINEESIGLLGFSLGAATAILVAAQEPEIPAVVADSCFADITEIMRQELPKRNLPGFLVHPITFAFKLIYGIDLGAVKPLDAVSSIAPRPLLLIHGEADTLVPVTHAERLFQASQNPRAELWVVSGAEHVKAYHTYPEEYIARVCAFFDQALP